MCVFVHPEDVQASTLKCVPCSWVATGIVASRATPVSSVPTRMPPLPPGLGPPVKAVKPPTAEERLAVAYAQLTKQLLELVDGC